MLQVTVFLADERFVPDWKGERYETCKEGDAEVAQEHHGDRKEA
jgi:hypothetical protein